MTLETRESYEKRQQQVLGPNPLRKKENEQQLRRNMALLLHDGDCLDAFLLLMGTAGIEDEDPAWKELREGVWHHFSNFGSLIPKSADKPLLDLECTDAAEISVRRYQVQILAHCNRKASSLSCSNLWWVAGFFTFIAFMIELVLLAQDAGLAFRPLPD